MVKKLTIQRIQKKHYTVGTSQLEIAEHLLESATRYMLTL